MKVKSFLLVLFLFLTSKIFVYGKVWAEEQTSIIDPTSSFILYESYGNTWLKDADGDRIIVNGTHPRLSPDGRYIVIRRLGIYQGDLYLYDMETKQDTKIFENNDFVEGFSWSVDGNRIYFDHGCEIYAMNRDGSNKVVILSEWPPSDPDSHGCYNDAPDVNPVDGRIAWHNRWHGIGIGTGEGQYPQWIDNTKPEDANPRWSPDGEWIAFYRANNLYTIRPDGSNLTQLTFLGDSDFMSYWSGAWEKGGSWIFASAYVYMNDHIFAIATDGSGKMVPVHTKTIYAIYVGNAGSWDFNFSYFFLPLVRN